MMDINRSHGLIVDKDDVVTDFRRRGGEDGKALQVMRVIIWAHRLPIILMVMAKLFVRTGNKGPAAGASGNYLPLVHLDVTIEKKMLDMLEEGRCVYMIYRKKEARIMK